jgi:hypothetical protein
MAGAHAKKGHEHADQEQNKDQRRHLISPAPAYAPSALGAYLRVLRNGMTAILARNKIGVLVSASL